MKRFIRISGLGAFVIVTAAIACTGIFLADGIVKSAIESAGSSAAGAKVELKNADISLKNPIGLTLTGLQVADKDSPMENLIQVDRITFLMDGGMILRKKLIVENMAVEGMAFGIKRSSSGALPVTRAASNNATKDKKATKPSSKKDSSKSSAEPFLTLDAPNIKDVFEKENLKTLQLANEYKDQLKAKQKAWEQRAKKLPNAKSIDTYKSRINKATKGKITIKNLQDRTKQVENVRKDVERDLKTIKAASKDLKADTKRFKKQYKTIKDAPKQDLDRLAKKYSLTPEGLKNLSSQFFGGSILALTEKTVNYYEKAQPYIEHYSEQQATKPKHERGKGIDVRFTEHNPQPDFKIERIAATAMLSYGQVAGTVNNITNAQDITGRPTTFEFSSQELKDMDTLVLNGALDRRTPGQKRDSFDLKATDIGLKNMVLSSSESFPVSMSNARLNLNVTGTINEGEMDTTITAKFSSVSIEAGGNSGGVIASTIASSLKGVTAFNLTAKLTGPVGDPEMSISSNLDNVLRNAASRAVNKQARRFRKNLRQEIRSRTAAKLSELEKQLGALTGLDKDVTARLTNLKNLEKEAENIKKRLRKQLENEVNKQKHKAEEELKDKLKKLF